MVLSDSETLLLQYIDREDPVKYSLSINNWRRKFTASREMFLELARRQLFEQHDWEYFSRDRNFSDEWLWATEEYWNHFNSVVVRMCIRKATNFDQFDRFASSLSREQIVEVMMYRPTEEQQDERWVPFWDGVSKYFTWTDWITYLDRGRDLSWFLQHYPKDDSFASFVLTVRYLQAAERNPKLYDEYLPIFVRLREMSDFLRSYSLRSRINKMLPTKSFDAEARNFIDKLFAEFLGAYRLSDWEDVLRHENVSDDGESDDDLIDAAGLESYERATDLLRLLEHCPTIVTIIHHAPFPEIARELASSMTKCREGHVLSACFEKCNFTLEQQEEIFMAHLGFSSFLTDFLDPRVQLSIAEKYPRINLEFGRWFFTKLAAIPDPTSELTTRCRDYIQKNIGHGDFYDVPEIFIPDIDTIAVESWGELVSYDNFPRNEQVYRRTQSSWIEKVRPSRWNDVCLRGYLSLEYRRELALLLQVSLPKTYQELAYDRDHRELQLPILPNVKYHPYGDNYFPEDEDFLVQHADIFLVNFGEWSHLDEPNPDDTTARFFAALSAQGRRCLIPTLDESLRNDGTFHTYILRFANFDAGELETVFQEISLPLDEKLQLVCERRLTFEQLQFFLLEIDRADEETRWLCYSNLIAPSSD